MSQTKPKRTILNHLMPKHLKSTFANLNRSYGFLAVNGFILFVLLNLVAQQCSTRIDLTRDRLNSVTESTKRVLSKPGNPILIEAYITQDLPGEVYSELQPIFYQLDEIKRIGGNRVQLQLIDPKDEESRTRAERRGIQGREFGQSSDTEASVRLGFFNVYLQSGEKSAIIDLIEGNQIVVDFEFRFLREVKRISRVDEKPSGIGIFHAKGGLETQMWQRNQMPDKLNMLAFRTVTEQQNGKWTDVNSGEPIPESVETLIVGGRPELDEKSKYYIDQFLMNGGKLILMIGSFDFDLHPPDPRMMQMGLGSSGGFAFVDQDSLQKINDWLKAYGLKVNGHILFEPNLSAPELDLQGRYIRRMRNPAWAVYSHETRNFAANQPLFQYTGQLVLPWFSDVAVSDKNQQSGVKYTNLILSSDSAVIRDSASLALKDMQTIGSQEQDRIVSQPLPLMIEAKGKFHSAFSGPIELGKDQAGANKKQFRPGQAAGTEATILLLGTPYLVSDIFLGNEQNMQIFQLNAAFFANLLDMLQGDTDLLAARSKVASIPLLEGPSSFTLFFVSQYWYEKLFQWFHIATLPLLLAIYGWLRLVRRNRKRGLTTEAAQ